MLRIAWIVLVSALQGVLPLLHANANGSTSADLHVHLHGAAPYGLFEVQFSTGLPHESVAIGVGDLHWREWILATSASADDYIPVARTPERVDSPRACYAHNFLSLTKSAGVDPTACAPPSR
jgi:hypothetical protein